MAMGSIFIFITAMMVLSRAEIGLIDNGNGTVHSSVVVNANTKPTPFPHFWKRLFGSSHAHMSLRPDWQDHLAKAVRDLGLGGLRYHGIFDDDMQVVVGHRIYNWSLVDKSWDYQISLGLTPVVELSFMPAILANCSWHGPEGPPVNPGKEQCHTIMYYQGVTAPPTNFDDWFHLVRSLAEHAVERYGIEKVSTWSFEVWNEMWGVDFPEPYMQLFNASSHALKSVNHRLKVGGPATMQLLHVADFIEAATEQNIQFDFVSSHMYPTDPQCTRGAPWSRDCFSDHVKDAAKIVSTTGKPFYMTEYNVGCCPDTQSDTAGGAAFAFQEFGQLSNFTDILSWWTFSDIFEEGGLRKSEFTNQFGMMTIHGIPKPTWRAFQLAHNLAGTLRIPVSVIEDNAPPSPPPPPPSNASCDSLPHTAIVGDDIFPNNTHLMLSSASACCEACFNHTSPLQCSAWTYDNLEAFTTTKGRCYLKTSSTQKIQSPSSTSGTLKNPVPVYNYSGPAVSAFATVSGEGKAPTLFMGYWNSGGGPNFYRLDREVHVKVDSKGPSPTEATEYRIDSNHANPLAAWVAMGSPDVPSAHQLSKLVEASEVIPTKIPVSNWDVSVTMEANSAVVIVFE